MHLKSFLSLALIVVLVYLSSYASAATYNYNQQHRRQPQNINRFDQGVQDEKPPNGRTKRWIDFTATALTHFVDAAVPRQSRANWGAIGLDNTEVFKQLMIKVLEWLAYVITELVHL